MEEVINEYVIQNLSIEERKYYLKQILIWLNYTHNKWIIHRDIQLSNILYDKLLHKLRIIECGLSYFYIENKDYNIRISSLQYKTPELLLNQTKYDYSIDMWSFWCIMGSLLFNRIPFFKCKDLNNQLKQIIQFIWYNDVNEYITLFNITLDSTLLNLKQINLNNYITEYNYKYITSESIDLLNKLLIFDYYKRITSEQALQHHFFFEKQKELIFITL